MKDVTTKLMQDPQQAEERKAIVTEVTERLRCPSRVMDHMMNELEEKMRRKRRQSIKNIRKLRYQNKTVCIDEDG